MDEAERVEPASVDEWSQWLADHHDSVRGVWLVTGRKDADRLVSYEESVLEALRYGWVDSTQKPVDETALDDVVRPTAPGQRVDADQQGPRRSPRGGRADGAGRRCCRRHARRSPACGS